MYLAYIFLFAAVSAIPTGRVEIVFPSVEQLRSGVKTVKFRALGEDVELKLEPAGDIIAKDFAFYNGNHEKQQSMDIESLRKRLYRDRTNGAALLIDDDEQPPSIEGIVFSKLRISPHEWKEVTEDGKRAHQVEELTSDRDSYLYDNIILPDFQREMINFTRIERDDQCLVIEVLCVTEGNFTERYETNEALTEYVTLMYSATETMLRQLDSGLQLRLSGIVAFTKETEPLFFKNIVHQDGDYKSGVLSEIRDYFCKNSTSLSKNADIILLLITRYMKLLKPNGSTRGIAQGIAYAGGVCDRCNKVNVIRGFMKPVSAAKTLAHEMAHLLGVPHDGKSSTGVSGSPGAKSCPSKDGFFMGDNEGANWGIFSKCSKDCAKYLLSKPQASCVYEECKSSRY
uniref:Putative metalloproteinase n=2 Tax=Tityus obscurus TaxID=1221240 RepID=A0A1E1WVV2_TITOB